MPNALSKEANSRHATRTESLPSQERARLGPGYAQEGESLCLFSGWLKRTRNGRSTCQTVQRKQTCANIEPNTAGSALAKRPQALRILPIANSIAPFACIRVASTHSSRSGQTFPAKSPKTFRRAVESRDMHRSRDAVPPFTYSGNW
jgi:hypothetical protein